MPAKTERIEVTIRWKRYRVFVYEGKVVRIDSINPTMGEKVIYNRIASNGIIAAQVKAHLISLKEQQCSSTSQTTSSTSSATAA